jgi:GT2 family glycosyltransferase
MFRRYYFLLNPDTYLKDNSIEILANRIQSDPALDIIGPQLLNTDGSNQSCIAPKSYLTLWRLFCDQLFLHRIFRRSKVFNSHLKDYINPDRECYVQNVSGAAFMFKRDIIDKIGLMDELFFMYFEETDYCLRADKYGLKMLYYPESKITHLIGSSNKPGSERSVRFFINSFKLYFKKNSLLLHIIQR